MSTYLSQSKYFIKSSKKTCTSDCRYTSIPICTSIYIYKCRVRMDHRQYKKDNFECNNAHFQLRKTAPYSHLVFKNLSLAKKLAQRYRPMAQVCTYDYWYYERNIACVHAQWSQDAVVINAPNQQKTLKVKWFKF